MRGRNSLARSWRISETLPHIAITDVTLMTTSPGAMVPRLLQRVIEVRMVWRVARVIALLIASSKAVWPMPNFASVCLGMMAMVSLI